MCGIIGFMTTEKTHSKKRADFFEQALYADALRGRHSTGLFTVEPEGKAFYAKDIVDAQRFLDSQSTYQYVRSTASDTQVAVGHNRWATNGGKGRDSAHPFTTQHVTMVHNGTLKFYQWLPKHEKAEVDSARLTQALSDAEPGGKEVWERLEGAYACVWYDNRNRNLYMVRNTERPLHYYVNEKTMYFASEGKMLEWILSGTRADVCNNATARMLPAHTIHRWDLTHTGTPLERLKPRAMRYTPKQPVVVSCNKGVVGGQNVSGGTYGTVLPKESRPTAQNSVADAAANNRLEKLGLSVKIGDYIEVQAGELLKYAPNGTVGKTFGWFEDCELDMMMLANGDFRGNVYADVHQVPLLPVESCNLGNWHDSYYARVVGIASRQEEWMNEHDLLLTTVFESIGARTEPFHKWKGKLKSFFKTFRYRYQINDLPKHMVAGQHLTNRELDMLVVESKCTNCDRSNDMVERDNIRVVKDLKSWRCKKCK